MESKQIKKLVERRHPRYNEMLSHWNFMESCYDGGRQWFEQGNIFRYIKEGDSEYGGRLARAYRFNHSREVVDLVNKYLFRPEIVRKEDAPQFLKDFWKRTTLRGLDMKEFMSVCATKSSTMGCPWVIVDNDLVLPQENVSKADVEKAKESANGIYCYVVRPQDVLDMGYDDMGRLDWILIREMVRDDDDPLTATGDVTEQFRLWTRMDWTLFKKEGRSWKDMDSGEHGLGVVPAVRIDNMFCDDPYVTPALIADVAYLDRAVANYLSNLDAIIQDQSFSQLAMPAQGLIPGEDAYNKMVEMGTKRIFLYDGEHGHQPHFLSPDPRQANLIISAIQQLINEIYHSVGLAGERTKADNAKGIDNSSGVAKMADFDRVLALLSAKATALETAENRIAYIVSLWEGQEIKEDYVAYSDSFDVRDLHSELEIATSVSTLDAPSSMVAQEMKVLLPKLFPNLKEEDLSRLESDIDEWEEKKESMFELTPLPSTASDGSPSAPRNLAEEGEQQSKTKASSN